MDRALIQKEYGYLGEALFFNASRVAVPPMRVRDACRGIMDDYADSAGDSISEFDQYRADAKDVLARLIHASTEEIAFTKNTTEGNSILARGLPLQPGDNVIIADVEHPSLLLPWLEVQKKGVEIRIVRSVDGEICEDDYLRLMDENTRVLAISAVQYGSGYFADLARLGAACRKNGTVFAVDAIQAVGRVTIDVEAMQIDYLSCGGFKSLLGTLGSGFLYCRRALIPQVVPCYLCYHATARQAWFPDIPTEFTPITLYDDARRFDAGSSNTYGVVAMGKGAELILELGQEAIRRHIMQLEQTFREKMSGKDYHIYVQEEARRSGVICMRFPKERTEAVRTTFREKRIYTTIRGGYIRAALHLYNTEEQIEIFARTLIALQNH